MKNNRLTKMRIASFEATSVPREVRDRWLVTADHAARSRLNEVRLDAEENANA